MNDLVERLQIEQEVKADLSSDRAVQIFKEAVTRGYVHLTFVKTGTTLGIPMDKAASDVTGADLEKRQGRLKVVGNFVLNYNKVCFHGDVDLATGEGKGRLEYLGEFKPGDKATS
jgi:hypothetical protein